MPATYGMLIHRDHIKRIRVFTAAGGENSRHDEASVADSRAAITHDIDDEVAVPVTSGTPTVA
ncbi:MAG TPA: hypothetical protein VLM76_09075 [Patescibacteria group bacterium]|nr:hypothetical protein [Patescibacteria group bacterium]